MFNFRSIVTSCIFSHRYSCNLSTQCGTPDLPLLLPQTYNIREVKTLRRQFRKFKSWMCTTLSGT